MNSANGLRRHRGMNLQHVRHLHQPGDRRDVADEVVRQLLVERGVDGVDVRDGEHACSRRAPRSPPPAPRGCRRRRDGSRSRTAGRASPTDAGRPRAPRCRSARQARSRGSSAPGGWDSPAPKLGWLPPHTARHIANSLRYAHHGILHFQTSLTVRGDPQRGVDNKKPAAFPGGNAAGDGVQFSATPASSSRGPTTSAGGGAACR